MNLYFDNQAKILNFYRNLGSIRNLLAFLMNKNAYICKNAQKSLEMIKKTQNEFQTLESEGNENQNGKLIFK